MPEASGRIFDHRGEEAIRSDFLEAFAFDSPRQRICIETPELSAVCPFSGLPDFGRLRILYYPTGGKCVELKSLKYYIVSFRNVGLYQEGVTRRIYDDLRQLLCTECIEVTTEYNVRGGFVTTCVEGRIRTNDD